MASKADFKLRSRAVDLLEDPWDFSEVSEENGVDFKGGYCLVDNSHVIVLSPWPREWS